MRKNVQETEKFRKKIKMIHRSKIHTNKTRLLELMKIKLTLINFNSWVPFGSVGFNRKIEGSAPLIVPSHHPLNVDLSTKRKKKLCRQLR